MNIYVGNLPFTTGEEELRATFGAYGQVASVAVIKDQFTGQSRGFGFVEMPNKDEGTAAINALNGKEVKGRALKVNEAETARLAGELIFDHSHRRNLAESAKRGAKVFLARAERQVTNVNIHDSHSSTNETNTPSLQIGHYLRHQMRSEG